MQLQVRVTLLILTRPLFKLSVHFCLSPHAHMETLWCNGAHVQLAAHADTTNMHNVFSFIRVIAVQKALNPEQRDYVYVQIQLPGFMQHIYSLWLWNVHPVGLSGPLITCQCGKYSARPWGSTLNALTKLTATEFLLESHSCQPSATAP